MLRGHTGVVYALAVDEATSMLYTGGGDQVIRSWDLVSLQNVMELQVRQSVNNRTVLRYDLAEMFSHAIYIGPHKRRSLAARVEPTTVRGFGAGI